MNSLFNWLNANSNSPTPHVDLLGHSISALIAVPVGLVVVYLLAHAVLGPAPAMRRSDGGLGIGSGNGGGFSGWAAAFLTLASMGALSFLFFGGAGIELGSMFAGLGDAFTG